jgi:hypothetical protein
MLEKMGCSKSKQALILLLNWFLYTAILITTSLQLASNAKFKKQPPPNPDALMMSVATTPLSNYLKIKDHPTLSPHTKNKHTTNG